MIGQIASLTLPSGFNPFLPGERLKEIGERLHRIVAASSADDAQAAWESFFCPRSETGDWCDQQINLIWGDQTQFVREATAAGIPWDKANATFDAVVNAAKEISRMPAELILWWTPTGRQKIIRDHRPRKWREEDVWQIAWQANHAILERSNNLMFPAINALDDLGQHILSFHQSATTPMPATPHGMLDTPPTEQTEGNTEHSTWTHNRAPGKMEIYIPRPRVSEQDVRRKLLEESALIVEATHSGLSAAPIGKEFVDGERRKLTRIRDILVRLGKDISKYRQTEIPIAPILGIFASEFGWTPDAVRSLTLYQIQMYLEQIEVSKDRPKMDEVETLPPASPEAPMASADNHTKAGKHRNGAIKDQSDLTLDKAKALPEWIIKYFRSKQYLLLKALWGVQERTATELFTALDYRNSVTQSESLRRRVTETNKSLIERVNEIGECWTIRERTRDGIKSYFLDRQK